MLSSTPAGQCSSKTCCRAFQASSRCPAYVLQVGYVMLQVDPMPAACGCCALGCPCTLTSLGVVDEVLVVPASPLSRPSLPILTEPPVSAPPGP